MSCIHAYKYQGESLLKFQSLHNAIRDTMFSSMYLLSRKFPLSNQIIISNKQKTYNLLFVESIVNISEVFLLFIIKFLCLLDLLY